MQRSHFSFLVLVLLCVHECTEARMNRKLFQAATLSVSTVNEFSSYPTTPTKASFVITIQAPKGGVADRAPVSVTAVLDRSGSMSGSKIQLLKRSTEFLVEKLQGSDSLGVVSYSSDVQEDGPLARVTPAVKETLRSTINRIVASGATNLSGGLFRGIEQQSNADVGTSNVKSVILFTDGLPTAGIRNVDQIVRQMQGSLNGEFPPIVYTLGFGNDHDASFLSEIAKAGKGQYVFVPDETKIAPVFGEILGGLLTVTAQNIEAKLTPLSGSSITSVKAGGTVSPGPSVWTIKFPDLFADEKRDILVDLSVPAGSASANQQVLKVDVSFTDPKTGTKIVRNPVFVVIGRSLAPQSTSGISNEKVEVTRLRFTVAEDIERAVDQKKNGDSAGATSTLDGTLNRISSSSANQNSEVQTLRSDVQNVRSQVAAPQALSAPAAGQLTANAQSLTAQRAVVSGGGGFASNNAGTTSAKLSVAGDAANFAATPGPPPSNPPPQAPLGQPAPSITFPGTIPLGAPAGGVSPILPTNTLGSGGSLQISSASVPTGQFGQFGLGG